MVITLPILIKPENRKHASLPLACFWFSNHNFKKAGMPESIPAWVSQS